MIKVVVIVLFYIMLILVNFRENTQVQVQFFPFTPFITLSQSWLAALFASAGIIVSVTLALIDRAQLNSQNREMHREMDRLRKEVVSLREMATMERDVE